MTDIKKNQETNPQNNSPKEKICCFKKIKSCCQSFNPSKKFIAVSCLMLGVASTLLVQNSSRGRENLDQEFFGSENIFAETALINKKINEVFENNRQHMKEVFNEVRQDNKSAVLQKEDDDSYFYELNFLGFKKEDIVVGVKNNVVTFAVEGKGGKEKNDYSYSSFHYSFLAPEYEVKKEPEIIREEGRVVVKLSKVKK